MPASISPMPARALFAAGAWKVEDDFIRQVFRSRRMLGVNARAGSLRRTGRVTIERTCRACDHGDVRANSCEAAMAKYLLVSFKTCPWVQRAAIVLREKKIEFEFRHIERDN